jgi:hypothetical protein
MADGVLGHCVAPAGDPDELRDARRAESRPELRARDPDEGCVIAPGGIGAARAAGDVKPRRFRRRLP